MTSEGSIVAIDEKSSQLRKVAWKDLKELAELVAPVGNLGKCAWMGCPESSTATEQTGNPVGYM